MRIDIISSLFIIMVAFTSVPLASSTVYCMFSVLSLCFCQLSMLV